MPVGNTFVARRDMRRAMPGRRRAAPSPAALGTSTVHKETESSTTARRPACSAGDKSLVVENLRKEYTRGKPVLKNISLTVAGQCTTAIIGPSGTGKSTLLRCINRLIEPTSGRILVSGQDICALRGANLRAARRRIGMVFQEYNLVERLSVMENVLCGRLGYISPWRAWLRKFPQEDIDRAYDLLDMVGLTEFARARADELSGGQRQRVGIARAVMQQPHILLADEPTSSLDPKTSVEIMELLREVAAVNDIPPTGWWACPRARWSSTACPAT